eukprot:439059-Pyramimonas_sp.AAC.1
MICGAHRREGGLPPETSSLFIHRRGSRLRHLPSSRWGVGDDEVMRIRCVSVMMMVIMKACECVVDEDDDDDE